MIIALPIRAWEEVTTRVVRFGDTENVRLLRKTGSDLRMVKMTRLTNADNLVCTENVIRVDDAPESPKLAE
jgi:hypothetical protein